MQIVIDIDEETYNRIMNGWMPLYKAVNLMENVQKGTPLPKGHGRLIDADNLDNTVMKMNEKDARITRNDYKLIDNVIFEMPTIIEADKESGDKE